VTSFCCEGGGIVESDVVASDGVRSTMGGVELKLRRACNGRRAADGRLRGRAAGVRSSRTERRSVLLMARVVSWAIGRCLAMVRTRLSVECLLQKT